MRFALLAAALPIALLAACDREASDEGPAEIAAPDPNGADAMASNDEAPAGPADTEARPVMQMQVVLERLGFGPGVVDGEIGLSTENALAGFQEANGLPVTGEADEPTKAALAQWSKIPATRVVTIPRYWGDTAYAALPEDVAQQAKLNRLGYESIEERLAERFHTTPEVLAMLNPAKAGASPAPFAPGRAIRVPNVGADWIDAGAIDDAAWLATIRSLGVGTRQQKAARIVVDKSAGWLKAYDKTDRLIAMFTVTTGSGRDPLPLGNWKVVGVSRNPDFIYNPDLFWDVSDSKEKQHLPPGPNSPVGVVWIDLDKPHYGIHGTPAPETIGRAQSHGCVRLTNWDAARLSLMVDGATKVLFQA